MNTDGRNWTPIIAIVGVAIVGLAIWAFVAMRDGFADTGAATTTSAVTYASEAYGISFSYPDSYLLTEAERGNGERRRYVISLMRKADLPPPVNGEGPPSIELTFYQNNLDNQALRGWVTGTNDSNYKLSPDGEIASTTVDGREAVRYRWSGLYEGVTTAFLHKGNIVAVSGTRLEPADDIVSDYEAVLESIRLTATKDDLIRVDWPLPNASVASPLRLKGAARGNWYFEASFPARVLDANGRELGVVPVQAIGEWMTTTYVPFDTQIRFSKTTTETGTLVLEKDNPSGLAEFANELRIPIRFATEAGVEPQTRTVQLYYYDAARDQGPGGAQCSKNGLVSVERRIPASETPLRDSIVELLKGALTESERAAGITTQFPVSGLTLRNVSLVNGIATLAFDDPQNGTSGGACRVAILWSQIEATAKQFPTVTSVRFVPDTLFQP